MGWKIGVDIRDGEAQFGTGEHVGDFPLHILSVSVSSIGIGRGSIASVDEMRVLKVGLESAGSVPGPACYGRGGADGSRRGRDPPLVQRRPVKAGGTGPRHIRRAPPLGPEARLVWLRLHPCGDGAGLGAGPSCAPRRRCAEASGGADDWRGAGQVGYG